MSSPTNSERVVQVVYSASLASCAIPGVFEPVELMAKGRDGNLEPYFKTGGWRWTDGGLQADLPKERLTELFNVNQFIVSQVGSSSRPRRTLPASRVRGAFCSNASACASHLCVGRTSLRRPRLRAS